MALNNYGLGFQFVATDLASKVMMIIKRNLHLLEAQAGVTFTNMQAMLNRLGAGIATAAVGFAGLKTEFSLAGKWGKLETAMSNVEKISFATRGEMEMMTRASQDMAMKMGKSPIEVAGAFAELAQQGFDTAESMHLIPIVLNAAAVGNLTAAESVELLIQAMKSFSLKVPESRYAMDQMNNAANAATLSMNDLRIGVGRMGQSVHDAGGTLSDGLAMFALAKNVIGSAEMAATATGIAFQRLSHIKVQKVLKDVLDIDVLDKEGNFIGALKTIGQTAERLNRIKGQGARAQFIAQVAARYGGKAVSSFVEQLSAGITDKNTGITYKGMRGLEAMLAKIEQVNNSTERGAKIMKDNWEGAIDRVKSAWEVLMGELGKPFDKALRPVVERLAVELHKAVDVIRDMNPETKDLAAKTAIGGSAFAAFVGSIMAFNAAGKLAKPIWAAMRVAFRQIGEALMAVAMDFPLIAAVVLAAVGIFLAVKNDIGGLGKLWDRVVTDMTKSADNFWMTMKSIGKYFGELWDEFSKGFSEVWVEMQPVFKELNRALAILTEAMFGVQKSMDPNNPLLAGNPSDAMKGMFRFLGETLAWFIGLAAKAVYWLSKLLLAAVLVHNAIFGGPNPKEENWVDWLCDKLTFLVSKLTQAAEGIKHLAAVSGLWDWMMPHVEPKPLPTKPRVESVPPPQPKSSEGDQASSTPSEPASAGVAATASINPFTAEPVQPAPGIDYALLADTLAKMPVILSVDGERLAIVVDRGRRSLISRGSGADLVSG